MKRVLLDPPRLLGAGTALEQRLLQSAQSDAAPPGARERMAAALAPLLLEQPLPGQPACPEPSEGARRASEGGAGWRALSSPRSALLGIAGAGVIYLLAALLARPASSPAASEPQAELGPAPDTQPPAALEARPTPALPAASPELTEGAPALLESAPQRRRRTPFASPTASRAAVAAEPAPAATSSRAAANAPGAAQPAGSLLQEVRQLDSIRSALRAGQLRRAARGLAQYDRRFPHGELAREKSVLALDLLVASGAHGQARARAAELLAQPGMARYAVHLRAILDAAPGTSSRESKAAAERSAKGSNTEPAHIRARR